MAQPFTSLLRRGTRIAPECETSFPSPHLLSHCTTPFTFTVRSIKVSINFFATVAHPSTSAWPAEPTYQLSVFLAHTALLFSTLENLRVSLRKELPVAYFTVAVETCLRLGLAATTFAQTLLLLFLLRAC